MNNYSPIYVAPRTRRSFNSGINFGMLAILILAAALIVGGIVGIVVCAPAIIEFAVNLFHSVQIPLLTITAIGMIGSIIASITFFCNKKDDAGYGWVVIAGALFMLGFVMTRL